MDALCAFCTQPAEYLCDHYLTWSKWGDDGDRRVKEMDGHPVTCDAPMCADCRTLSGQMFDLYGPGQHETHDLCPVHADAWLADRGELSAGQAESIRLRDWKFKYLQRRTTPPPVQEQEQ